LNNSQTNLNNSQTQTNLNNTQTNLNNSQTQTNNVNTPTPTPNISYSFDVKKLDLMLSSGTPPDVIEQILGIPQKDILDYMRTYKKNSIVQDPDKIFVELEDAEDLVCPITQTLFENPVTAEDGHVYEKEAIEKWVKEHHSSPMTKETMNSVFFQSRPMRGRVIDFREKRIGKCLDYIDILKSDLDSRGEIINRILNIAKDDAKILINNNTNNNINYPKILNKVLKKGLEVNKLEELDFKTLILFCMKEKDFDYIHESITIDYKSFMLDVSIEDLEAFYQFLKKNNAKHNLLLDISNVLMTKFENQRK